MKTKLFFTVVLMFTIALLLVWLLQTTKKSDESSTESLPETPALAHTGNPPLLSSANELTSEYSQVESNDFASNVVQEHLPNLPRIEDSKFYQDWKRPITFYGKVVDETANPVSGVDVHFSWTDTSPDGRSERDAQSDADGFFSLSGVTGRMLSVRVNKAGYYTSKRGLIHFDYSPNFSVNPHHPDPSNPVVFYLRKQGTGINLITSQYGVFDYFDVRVPIDGQPTRVDFLNRKAGVEGQIELSAIKPQRDIQDRSAKEWEFRLSIPDGGFIEHNDEFPFEAPQDGYQSTLEFHFVPGEPNWTANIRGRYYIAFGQPRRYGWIEFETGIYRGVRLKYAINPEGSRNLEPK